jgi:hypothetical protein
MFLSNNQIEEEMASNVRHFHYDLTVAAPHHEDQRGQERE